MILVVANGERIRDLGEKNIPFKTNEGIQRCITFRNIECCQTFHVNAEHCPSRNIVVLDGKKPHIQNIRDGTMFKMDVNSGVCTMDMWICLVEAGPVFSWQ